MPEWYGGSTLNPSNSTPPQDQWRDQWERTLRWYGQVRQIEQKSLQATGSREDEADSLNEPRGYRCRDSIFQNCYHLRDWLLVSRPSLKGPLDKFFRSHFEMGPACRDICNGFKHKVLDRPTHDKDFNLYRECDHLEAMGRGGNSPVRHRAVFADGSVPGSENLIFSNWQVLARNFGSNSLLNSSMA